MISEYDSGNREVSRLQGKEKLEAENPIRKQLSGKMMPGHHNCPVP